MGGLLHGGLFHSNLTAEQDNQHTANTKKFKFLLSPILKTILKAATHLAHLPYPQPQKPIQWQRQKSQISPTLRKKAIGSGYVRLKREIVRLKSFSVFFVSYLC